MISEMSVINIGGLVIFGHHGTRARLHAGAET